MKVDETEVVDGSRDCFRVVTLGGVYRVEYIKLSRVGQVERWCTVRLSERQ